jgi:putative Ca2+/H+ antiporter (TMEM165/GDT1 family)
VGGAGAIRTHIDEGKIDSPRVERDPTDDEARVKEAIGQTEMLHAFWATYAAVFAAEILGDKFLYTPGILSTRYRTPPMLIGIVIAFMAKMGVAVAIGDALAGLPRVLLGAVTAPGIIWIALTFWRSLGPAAFRDQSLPFHPYVIPLAFAGDKC